MGRGGKQADFGALPVDLQKVLLAIYGSGSRLEPKNLIAILGQRIDDWKTRDSYEDDAARLLFGATDDAEWKKQAARGYRVGPVEQKSRSVRRVRGILSEGTSVEDQLNAEYVAEDSEYADTDRWDAMKKRQRWNALMDVGFFDIHDTYAALHELLDRGQWIRIPRKRPTYPKKQLDPELCEFFGIEALGSDLKTPYKPESPRPLLHHEDLVRAIKLGHTPKRIASDVGCSLSTVYRYLKRYGLSASDPDLDPTES